MLKLIKILLPLSWMCLIFVLSDISYDSFPAETTNAQQIMAHIFLYGVLSYLVILALVGWQKRDTASDWRLCLLAIAFSIFYGITDEYHQGFVLGRFVSFADLAFDSLGAILGAVFYWLLNRPHSKSNKNKKSRLLLHICCAGCGAHVSKLLKLNFNVTLYFYNPNIYPESEYKKRLEEAENIAKKFGLSLIVGEHDHDKWRKSVKGHENDLEKGERCLICYKDRLESAAKLAKAPVKSGTGKRFDYFTTTLTISPHKDARAINRIGNKLAGKYGVNPSTGAQDLSFLGRDFKKQDGFVKSVKLSKELGLYRQDYCGCEYSNKTDGK